MLNVISTANKFVYSDVTSSKTYNTLVPRTNEALLLGQYIIDVHGIVSQFCQTKPLVLMVLTVSKHFFKTLKVLIQFPTFHSMVCRLNNLSFLWRQNQKIYLFQNLSVLFYQLKPSTIVKLFFIKPFFWVACTALARFWASLLFCPLQ